LKKRTITIVALLVVLCACLIITYAAALNDNARDGSNEEKQVVEFTDVKSTDWFYKDVQYVQKNNLMNGMSKTEFSPSGVTTRGMIVTILWRLEGEPVIEGKTFNDVNKGAYYYDAVAWASANQIVSGYSETTFAPNDTATREQLATIIYRYASYKNYDISKEAELDKYVDKDQISEYAVKSIMWANANGIISGTSESTISPKDNVQRCQVAAILNRFCNNIANFENEQSDENDKTEQNQDDDKSEKPVSGDSGSSGKVPPVGAGSTPDMEIEDRPIDDIFNREKPVINVETVYGKPGEVIQVNIDLEKNPGILGMILSLEYDDSALCLLNVENGDAVSDVLTLTPSKSYDSGVRFVWDGLELSESDIVDGTILTLEFEVSNDAVVGKRYPLKFNYNYGDIVDGELEEVYPSISQGYIEVDEPTVSDEEEE